MMFSNGLYLAAVKDFFESQYGLSKTLTEATMGCAEEVIALSIQTVKSGLAETTVFTQQLMTAKDQQERISLTAARFQARMGKTLAFSQQMTDAVTKVQTTFSDEMHRYAEDAKRTVGSMMDNTDNGSPTGFKSALGVMKSALESAHDGVVQFNQSARETSVKMADAANAFSRIPEVESSRVSKK